MYNKDKSRDKKEMTQVTIKNNNMPNTWVEDDIGDQCRDNLQKVKIVFEDYFITTLK